MNFARTKTKHWCHVCQRPSSLLAIFILRLVDHDRLDFVLFSHVTAHMSLHAHLAENCNQRQRPGEVVVRIVPSNYYIGVIPTFLCQSCANPWQSNICWKCLMTCQFYVLVCLIWLASTCDILLDITRTYLSWNPYERKCNCVFTSCLMHASRTFSYLAGAGVAAAVWRYTAHVIWMCDPWAVSQAKGKQAPGFEQRTDSQYIHALVQILAEEDQRFATHGPLSTKLTRQSPWLGK